MRTDVGSSTTSGAVALSLFALICAASRALSSPLYEGSAIICSSPANCASSRVSAETAVVARVESPSIALSSSSARLCSFIFAPKKLAQLSQPSQLQLLHCALASPQFLCDFAYAALLEKSAQNHLSLVLWERLDCLQHHGPPLCTVIRTKVLR